MGPSLVFWRWWYWQYSQICCVVLLLLGATWLLGAAVGCVMATLATIPARYSRGITLLERPFLCWNLVELGLMLAVAGAVEALWRSVATLLLLLHALLAC